MLQGPYAQQLNVPGQIPSAHFGCKIKSWATKEELSFPFIHCIKLTNKKILTVKVLNTDIYQLPLIFFVCFCKFLYFYAMTVFVFWCLFMYLLYVTMVCLLKYLNIKLTKAIGQQWELISCTRQAIKIRWQANLKFIFFKLTIWTFSYKISSSSLDHQSLFDIINQWLFLKIWS
jgi:hypothetical protein